MESYNPGNRKLKSYYYPGDSDDEKDTTKKVELTEE